jgi:histidinol-phosphate/aromatic aminotransferase/cobyric acid decarboxylase-like protein
MSAFGAFAALNDQEGLKEKIRLTNEGRDYIESTLSKIEGLTVYHTNGNYILLDATEADVKGENVVNWVMKKHNILLRKIAPFKGREGLFRITIGNNKENIECVRAIQEYFKTREGG